MCFLRAQPLAGGSDLWAVSGPCDSLLGDHRGGKEERQSTVSSHFPWSPEFQALPVSRSTFHQLKGATYFKMLCCFMNHQDRKNASS